MGFCFSILIYTLSVFYFIVCRISADISSEDKFVEYFVEHDRESYHSWNLADKWALEPSQYKLKQYCALAHKISGRGSCKVNLVLFKMRWLSFMNSSYSRRPIDLVEYGCQEGAEPDDIRDYWTVTVDDRWYITEGTKWDCIFYLTRVNSSVEFILDEHVCGVKMFEIHYILKNNTHRIPS